MLNKEPFTADGYGNLRLSPEVLKARRSIADEVRSQCAKQLNSAGWLRKSWLQFRIHREIERRLDEIAPRGALY